ncbi:MAG: RING finger protein [Oscillospiraceae bacterium]
MSRFDNKLCPVCRIPLNGNSDVVVCPECGTPHHRACYLRYNRCGVESWHATGFVWNGRLPDEEPEEPPQEEQTTQDAFQTSENDPHRAEYPGGTPNVENPGDMGSFGGIDFDQIMKQMRSQTMDDTRGADDVSNKELSFFVGKSVMHYSQAFSVFRAPVLPGQKKRHVFFNVCSGLFAPVHQFYRRMDLAGIALLLIELLYYVPTLLNAAGIGSLEVLRNIQMVASLISFAAMILMCLFGDYIYYRHCIKKIKKIRMDFDDGRAEGYYQALTEKGSPSWLRAIIGILAVYFAEAALLLLITKVGTVPV